MIDIIRQNEKEISYFIFESRINFVVHLNNWSMVVWYGQGMFGVILFHYKLIMDIKMRSTGGGGIEIVTENSKYYNLIKISFRSYATIIGKHK